MKTLKEIRAKRQEAWDEGNDDKAHGFTNLLGDIGRNGGLKDELCIPLLQCQLRMSKMFEPSSPLYDMHQHRIAALEWFFTK